MVIAYDMIWTLPVGVNYWLSMEIFCYWPLRSEDSDVTSVVISPMVNENHTKWVVVISADIKND